MAKLPVSALSVREVAELLGIRQHSVLALIHKGELRAVNVSVESAGKPRWRILREDLDAFLLRRTHQAAPPRRRRRRARSIPNKYF